MKRVFVRSSILEYNQNSLGFLFDFIRGFLLKFVEIIRAGFGAVRVLV